MNIKLTSIGPDGSKEDLGLADKVERFEAKLVSGYYATTQDSGGREVTVTLEDRDGMLICEYPNGYKVIGEIV